MTIANGQPAKMKRAFELLAAAEQLHDSSELHAPLITNVIDTLTEAIGLFAAFDDGFQRTDWQALCQIASARALYLRAFLKGDHSGVSSAIDSARKGLESISTQTHPQDCIDAYLLMATGLQQLATTDLCSDPGNQQFQALTALQAADYLSLKDNMFQKRAGVLRDKAIFLETYFVITQRNF